MPVRPRRAVVAALLATLVAFSAACASKKGGRAPEPTTSFVVFTNQSADQAAVYARRAGTTALVRIGSVAPGRTETLRVPPTVSHDGSLAILTRMTARRGTLSSGDFQLRPGERVAVTLPAAGAVLLVLPMPEGEP